MMTFSERRARALVKLSYIIANAHRLASLLERLSNVRDEDGSGWAAWYRAIDSANDGLGSSIAEVTRNGEVPRGD